jgi:hypothetical protein
VRSIRLLRGSGARTKANARGANGQQRLNESDPRTQNQALAALLFLYQHVLDQAIDDLGDLSAAKRPARTCSTAAGMG